MMYVYLIVYEYIIVW